MSEKMSYIPKPEDQPQSNERGIDLYEYFLGFSKEDLRGKSVLNIGSGKTGLLEKALKKLDCNVFTMSPYFGEGDQSEMVRSYSKKSLTDFFKKGTIHIIPDRIESNKNIPIEDNVLDYVLSLYSVPLYLETNEDKEYLLVEINRILKKNGKAFLYPIPESDVGYFTDILQKYFKVFNFTKISERGDTVYLGEESYRLEIQKYSE